ncbi:MAG: hypothetical protein L3J88_08110 [Gammaproteobacteria bacterium]|nr:hypothetical protein [Gammaproteobacteria bacterium]MCF6363294.1 hypothetical protein [Gammaproteobacteria bacterium]
MSRLRSRHLVQLLRLQGLRVSTAEAEYRARRAKCDTVMAAMRERQARIEDLRHQRTALFEHVATQGAAELTRFAGFASARRAWLDESLERDEYWLQDDERELHEAEAQAEEARQQWLRARSRESGTQNLLDDTRRSLARDAEQRQEMEAAEQMASGRMR